MSFIDIEYLKQVLELMNKHGIGHIQLAKHVAISCVDTTSPVIYPDTVDEDEPIIDTFQGPPTTMDELEAKLYE